MMQLPLFFHKVHRESRDLGDELFSLLLVGSNLRQQLPLLVSDFFVLFLEMIYLHVSICYLPILLTIQSCYFFQSLFVKFFELAVLLALQNKRYGNFGAIVTTLVGHFVNVLLKKADILINSIYFLLIRAVQLLLAPGVYQETKRIRLRLYDVRDALDLGEFVVEKGVFLKEALVFFDDNMQIIGVAALSEPIAKVRILSRDLVVHFFVLFLLLVHPHPQPFQTFIRILLVLLADHRVLALRKDRGLLVVSFGVVGGDHGVLLALQELAYHVSVDYYRTSNGNYSIYYRDNNQEFSQFPLHPAKTINTQIWLGLDCPWANSLATLQKTQIVSYKHNCGGPAGIARSLEIR